MPPYPGLPTRKLTWSDIEQKFLDCADHSPILRSDAEQAFQRLRALADCNDMADIVSLLTLRA